MLWTAPTTGIAMCQNALLSQRQQMSYFGYNSPSGGACQVVCFALSSGSLGANVSFLTDFVGSTSESRRGTSSRFSSARDPKETSARPNLTLPGFAN
jgi:hypothetical protein